jgi:hypothetical protein
MKKLNDDTVYQSDYTRPDLLYGFSVIMLLLAFGYILFGIVCITASDYKATQEHVDFEDSTGGN